MVLSLGAQPWGNHFLPIDSDEPVPSFPLDLFFCHDCTLVQIGYTIPKEFMFRDHKYLSGTTRSLRAHFADVARRILERVALRPGDYVLDIGGNDGTFLRCFADRGIRGLNVESAYRQAKISEEHGIACVNEFFNAGLARRLRETHGPARVIHGSGILFHMEELHSALDGIAHLLAADGIVVAEFIYLPEMIRNNAFDQVYHEHLVYYSIWSFEQLLRRHALAIEDVEFEAIHGGSCIAYVRHARGVAPAPAVREAVAAERAQGFDALPTYEAFAARSQDVKRALRTIVDGLRAQGRRIHALGAPVKGSTFVHFCGLTEADLECAVEVNPMKCDTYLPGTRIPVYHQDAVAPPDCYLLLAWNFQDEILEKLAEFRRGGGQILVPFPTPRLI